MSEKRDRSVSLSVPGLFRPGLHTLIAQTEEVIDRRNKQSRPSLKPPNIGCMDACMEDERRAVLDKNPSWGPLFVRHPGDLVRDRLCIPAAAGQGL